VKGRTITHDCAPLHRLEFAEETKEPRLPSVLMEELSFLSGKPHHLSESVLRNYDKLNSGYLDLTELKLLFTDAFPDEKFSDADMKCLMESLDLNQDGRVGLNELRAFLRLYNPSTKDITVKTALIIIDVQNDFITGSLANPYDATTIVPVINGMRDRFDVVVISYDWHPHDHCSFTASHNAKLFPIKETSDKFEDFGLVTLLADQDRAEHQQMLFPRHAVQGTEGGCCPPDLVVKDSDLRVYKGTKPNIDSFSAFFDNCKANDTGLTKMLEDVGVTDCYYCGLVTDICVKSTALHGVEAGFRSYFIEDASKPLDEANLPQTRQELSAAGVHLVSAQEACDMAAGSKAMALRDYLSQLAKQRNAKAVHAHTQSHAHAHA